MASQRTRGAGAPRQRFGVSRSALLGALLGTALVVLGVVLVLALGGSGHAGGAHAGAAPPDPVRATSDAPRGSPAAAPATVGGAKSGGATTSGRTAGGRADGGAVVEARDPEEAKSFPVPSASVHHAVATRPSAAAEEVLAPGAQSNSEVRAELKQMHAVERAAQKQEAATTSIVPGGDSIGGDGQLAIPQGIPEVVQRVIAGANAIADFPYVYGGGHASFVSNSYDCSGSVSYALAAGGLLSAPETSGTLESWGEPGPGKWITIYANAGHVYMYVNIGGRWMRFDTVGRSGTYASRWQPDIRSNAGFVARHWPGL